MVQHVHQERDIRLDAADTHLFQGTQGFMYGALKGTVVGNQFYQKAVVVRQDLCTGVGIAAIQTQAVTGTGTVYADLAGIRQEVVGRILGGDTGLDGISVHMDVILRLDVDLLGIQRISFRDEDLCLHDINAGDLLSYGVLYLDTRVHLDEIRVVVRIHQELQRTCILVAHLFCQADGAVQDDLSRLHGNGEGRRVLYHLLMTALYGTVTVIQMYHVAIFIAQDLHFDVLRAS